MSFEFVVDQFTNLGYGGVLFWFGLFYLLLNFLSCAFYFGLVWWFARKQGFSSFNSQGWALSLEEFCFFVLVGVFILFNFVPLVLWSDAERHVDEGNHLGNSIL